MLWNYQTTVQKLQFIHQCLLTGNTGNREEFARKVGISVAQLSIYLRYIRDQGIKIEYDREFARYHYEDGVTVSYECGFKKL